MSVNPPFRLQIVITLCAISFFGLSSINMYKFIKLKKEKQFSFPFRSLVETNFLLHLLTALWHIGSFLLEQEMRKEQGERIAEKEKNHQDDDVIEGEKSTDDKVSIARFTSASKTPKES